MPHSCCSSRLRFILDTPARAVRLCCDLLLLHTPPSTTVPILHEQQPSGEKGAFCYSISQAIDLLTYGFLGKDCTIRSRCKQIVLREGR